LTADEQAVTMRIDTDTDWHNLLRRVIEVARGPGADPGER
jgi:hypothetical protein